MTDQMEPVAWAVYQDGRLMELFTSPSTAKSLSDDMVDGVVLPLYTSDQVKGLTDHIAELEAALAETCGGKATCDQVLSEWRGRLEKAEVRMSGMMDQYYALLEDYTTAEAALAEARKVIEAADKLNEQAEHVGTGGCIPSMNIHDAAKELLPLVTIYEAVRAEWGWIQANRGDA
jgi:hypothetical protein